MSFRLWKEKEKTAMIGEDRMGDRSARCRDGSPSEGHEKKPLPWFLFFFAVRTAHCLHKGAYACEDVVYQLAMPYPEKRLRAFMSLRLVTSSTAAIRALTAW